MAPFFPKRSIRRTSNYVKVVLDGVSFLTKTHWINGLGWRKGVDWINGLIFSELYKLDFRKLESKAAKPTSCSHVALGQASTRIVYFTKKSKNSETERQSGVEMAEGKGRVCVTGGTGFIASWLIKRLLEDGYAVNTTIRPDPERKRDISYLTNLPGASEKLKIFQADMSDPESFGPSVEGCVGVFHTATPIDFEAADEVALTKKAVDGTLGILRACLKAKCVKRVVYTSSASTVSFLGPQPKDVVDEDDWSDIDFLRTFKPYSWPYAISKTATEKAALEFGQQHGLDVVSLVPPFVVGGFVCPKLPDSIEKALSLLFGKAEQLGITRFHMVHGDDLARAHIFLLEHPNPKGRYNCSPFIVPIADIGQILRAKYPEYQIPTVEELKEMKGIQLPHLTSKKLEDAGFEFKYSIEDMFVDAIECIKQKDQRANFFGVVQIGLSFYIKKSKPKVSESKTAKPTSCSHVALGQASTRIVYFTKKSKNSETERQSGVEMAEGKGRVCVTGGTGFIASWIIKRLLEDGYAVNTTIRPDPERKRDISYLTNLPGAPEKLKIFQADMSDPESFGPSVEGCVGVFHTATPIDFEAADEVALTKKAVDGTLGILRACLKAKCVKRVVYTSSASTVSFLGPQPKDVVDEDDWSDIDFLKTLKPYGWPYAISKTLTEKAALEFGQQHGLDVVSLVPPFVVGGFVCPKLPDSIEKALGLLFGKAEKLGITRFHMVHGDDLARAHIFLLEHPNPKGRYNCSPFIVPIADIGQILRAKYPEYQIPTVEELKEMKGAQLPHLTSKKLEDAGFEFKYSIEDMFVDAIECIKQKGYL
ncbi:hypothetical protein Fmac_018071 [Flemingia macrophylla]|uniref:NAD-dependent epimerase/dehydratase domain-containing protein n=1 Tax=Flemingia macrophylla TaxID=520843 RepID=A0ABD1M3Y3_9FABA